LGKGLYIRLGFVGYRDFGDEKHGGHFKIKEFTENVQEIRDFITRQ
jgi:hypothetical protein